MNVKPTLIAALILQLAFASISLYLAYKAMIEPALPGEFNALKNASSGLMAGMTILLSSVLFLLCLPLFKKKKWAWITSLILVPFTMLILGVGDIEILIFELGAGNPISVTSEILPGLLIVLLIASFRSFVGSKNQN